MKKRSSPLQLQYWINKGLTKDEAKTQLEKEIDKRSNVRVNYWLNKGLTKDEAKIKISEIQKVNNSKVKNRNKIKKNQLQYWINKGLTKDEAKIEQKKITDKSNRFIVPFWLERGLTEEEAKIKITEIQEVNSSKVKNKRNGANLQLWLERGLTEEEAKIKITEIQTTFSKEICIEKFGKTEGLKRWQERQDNWQNTLQSKPNISEINKSKAFSKEKYIKKYGKNKYYNYIKNIKYNKKNYIKKHGEDKFIEMINKQNKWRETSTKKYKFIKHSKISMELFDSLQSQIDNTCLYGKNEKCIKFIQDDGKNKYYYADFLINNIIIEFYGDYWHANPSKYDPDYIIESSYYKYTAQEKWDQDNIRMKNLESLGYNTIIIWEKQYNEDKLKTINYCLEQINKHKI